MHQKHESAGNIKPKLQQNKKKLTWLDLSFNLIKEITPTMLSSLVSTSLIFVDVMSDPQNIRAELPSLTSLYLTTFTWDCDTILALAKIYNNEGVSLNMNIPENGTEAVCKTPFVEINNMDIIMTHRTGLSFIKFSR